MSECREHEPLRRQGSPCPYCRIAELEAQLRDIALMAKPVAATAKNTSAVRTGHELGGYIKHYIVPTHLITAIKGMHKTIARMTHRNGVECVHGKFLHEDCPKCRGE